MTSIAEQKLKSCNTVLFISGYFITNIHLKTVIDQSLISVIFLTVRMNVKIVPSLELALENKMSLFFFSFKYFIQEPEKSKMYSMIQTPELIR